MKILSGLIFLFLYLLLSGSLNAQEGYPGDPILPIQQHQSPLFGKDVVIHDIETENQDQVKICSAFNGWLYAAYSYYNTLYNCPAIHVLKSTDNGITWDSINEIFSIPTDSSLFLDLAVIGDSISNLKLFISFNVSNGTPYSNVGYVDRFNGVTGVWEDILLQDNFCYRISLSSDGMYPASNSHPHSLGILYSAHNYISNNRDTIVFLSSSNGGMSLDNKQILAITGNKYHKVALAYGRSPSWNSGRYFAAWEEKATYNSMNGHIYTAHSNPYFNSGFTTPICLDSIDPSAINRGRNPAIACQYNNMDNDSSNLTEVVLFDKYISSNHKYNIEGFYNLQAANHTNFKKLTISNSGDYICQPSMAFNPFDSTFMVTYYDSTTQKLPFVANEFNLRTPDNWPVISSGYNDDDNLAQPYPKVAIDMGQKKGVNVWSKEGAGGHGIAMFDAQYSTWTGFSESANTDNNQRLQVYPNPCNSTMNIAFELKGEETVKITVYNQLGEMVEVVSDRSYARGYNLITYDVSKLYPGIYSLTFISRNVVRTGKIIKVR